MPPGFVMKEFLNKIIQNSFFKKTSCCVIAFAVVLVLFYIMSVLISGRDDLKKPEEMPSLVEFIRTKPRDFLEEKKRKMPQKKPKELKPPPMKRIQTSIPKMEKMNMKLDMPNIKSLLAGSGPRLGGLGFSSDREVTPLVRIEPVYPNKARQRGIEGEVFLQFDVTSAGFTENIKILDSKPPRVFDKDAVRALRKWKYRPKIEDGKAVEQLGLRTVIDFQLEGEESLY